MNYIRKGLLITSADCSESSDPGRERVNVS
jgi:hypothetical protein